MKLLFHFLLISSLPIIIIAETKLDELSTSRIERIIIEGNQSTITGLHETFKLLEEGEIFRSSHTLIWKATYKTSTNVAVKIFNEKEKFDREIGLYEKMNATHEHFDFEKYRIPKVYYHGEIFGDFHAIVMTLCEENFEMRVKTARQQRKRFSESTILLIFKQLIETLQYIHSKDVLHNLIGFHTVFIRGQDVFIGGFGCHYSKGSRRRDYEDLLDVIWMLAGAVDFELYELACYRHQTRLHNAFKAILKDKKICEYAETPHYDEIIKKLDEALSEIRAKSGPPQIDWLREGSSGESSKNRFSDLEEMIADFRKPFK